MQCRLIIINDFPEFLPHQFPENIICTVKYFSPASEVPVKINSLPATLLRTVAVLFLYFDFYGKLRDYALLRAMGPGQGQLGCPHLLRGLLHVLVHPAALQGGHAGAGSPAAPARDPLPAVRQISQFSIKIKK